MKKVAILGSTGSIGIQTLEVIRSLRDEFKVVGLACGNNIHLLEQQITEFKPDMISAASTNLPYDANNVSMEMLVKNPDIDIVVIATSGYAGLIPTLEALKANKTVALASKEVIVIAGKFISELLKNGKGNLYPVDSEHSAIWQCLQGERSLPRRILLTASGGPFYSYSQEELNKVTVLDTLKHPVWDMGEKITVDSATLMNKGLEALEASYLFSVPLGNIEILHHPQCLIHSMVEFEDGSIKAQAGIPDMHVPIQYALSYPDRLDNTISQKVDFEQQISMTFEKIEKSKYPCLKLAFEVGEKDGSYPAVLCAADESAVHLFLSGRIAFSSISSLIEEAVQHHNVISNPSIDDVLDTYRWATNYVNNLYENDPDKYR